MGRDILEIQIRRIRPNLRIIYASESIEEIARDIDSCGQREPIHISFEYDSFRIIDGEKRWRACKRLGLTSIMATIT